jgi:hypothetical protein
MLFDFKFRSDSLILRFFFNSREEGSVELHEVGPYNQTLCSVKSDVTELEPIQKQNKTKSAKSRRWFGLLTDSAHNATASTTNNRIHNNHNIHNQTATDDNDTIEQRRRLLILSLSGFYDHP